MFNYRLHVRLSCFLLAVSLFTSMSVWSRDYLWQSSLQKNTLVELYTSEGCSSCPHADRWLARWREEDALWNEVIPVAFHVDYWDDLGWVDDYAQASFSKRQRLYNQQGQTKAVYTPGFLLAGKEWRGYFSQQSMPKISREAIGVLSGELKNNSDVFSVKFKPGLVFNNELEEPLVLYVALLGMDIESSIETGENSGRLLQHEFVVLSLTKKTSVLPVDHYSWEVSLPSERVNDSGAIAFWVSSTDSLVPIQAAGGWLNNK